MENKSVALIHTGAVVIAPTNQELNQVMPGVRIINYLDDKIVADLRDADLAASVPLRLQNLVEAAKEAGAQVAMYTCSSISETAAAVSESAGLPVLRIDEAMADQAVSQAQSITVLATLPTTCGPTVRLLEERAARQGKSPQIADVVIPGAFAAVASGDRETHDSLVAAAVTEAAENSDVIVLAQASMAGVAESVTVEVPVLSSIGPGMKRLAQWLDGC